MPEASSNELTSGRVLAWNTVVSLVGRGAPMLVAIFAVPLLIDGLGANRYGILNLAWMVDAYFVLFGLGLSGVLIHPDEVA